jgi:aromatic ring-opening dioxygenase catalytic subunit (LigB family)
MTLAGSRASCLPSSIRRPATRRWRGKCSSCSHPLDVDLDDRWGLDHGTWSVLCHVFPKADVPVVQLSIDETRAPHFHYEIGQQLRPLRDAGVLIVGSGDIVHNLHAYAWGRHPLEPYDWATRFESRVRDLIDAREHAPLVDYGSLGKDALLSVPTPEHYLPLLYVLGAAAQMTRYHFQSKAWTVDRSPCSQCGLDKGRSYR